jgi:hypothetical protein
MKTKTRPKPNAAPPCADVSELDAIQQIEIALADAERALKSRPARTVTIPAHVKSEIAELLNDLLAKSNQKSAGTLYRLSFVLAGIMPTRALEKCIDRAADAVCKKNGVTFC